jgi:hypothetical protein
MDITFYNNLDPSSYVPECGDEYRDYYGEYQQWRDQHNPSSQYPAGDAAVTCEEFISEQPTSALCGNIDNCSVLGTEASAHSTVSLCDGGEDKCDDITFYNMLFGIGGDEQKDAADPADVVV